jgi:hypothetical protein
LPPFDKANDSYFLEEEMRLNTDYWNYVYISDANKRGFGDAFGGESTRVHPTEHCGALRTSSYAYGWNVSARLSRYCNGMYNHSTMISLLHYIRKKYFNASYNSFINAF